MFAPVYMTPPSTEPIRAHIRAGRLGAICTPRQGNKLQEGWEFCIDNGAFSGKYVGDEEFLALLKKLRHLAPWCRFVVAPDVPFNHPGTWQRSRDMLPRIRDTGFPAALAAQDLMDLDMWDHDDDYDSLFIAGSDAFKLSKAAAALAAYAGDLGKWRHMGRVNSRKRYRYAAAIGCDSVDGTYLTNAPDKLLSDVLGWRADVEQQEPVDLPQVADICDQSYLVTRFGPARRPPASTASPEPDPSVLQEALF
ncbi:hypothetical protein [Nonomuraea sp. NPDC049784]|uniref:hypothetical protein n=1 Tax=Nonomuraea sp. NPDC049784 TaxID=3154361 RepID=UPI0033FEFF0F